MVAYDCLMLFHGIPTKLYRMCIIARDGLTIGQTGQIPGALRLNIKTLLYKVSRVFRLRVKIVQV